MRTTCRHFRAPPTHFRSRDVINVFWGKTAITPLFFRLKTSSKTKLIHDLISNEPSHNNDKFLQKMGEKCLSKM